jgi:hypothetical protein
MVPSEKKQKPIIYNHSPLILYDFLGGDRDGILLDLKAECEVDCIGFKLF